MNLPLEKLECESLKNETLEKKYAKYLKDFTKQEFENEFLLGEDHIEEVFGYLSSFIEESLMSRSPLLYAQTTRMLKFYKNHLRRTKSRVLFVHLSSSFE
jgi:subtilase family serine protease